MRLRALSVVASLALALAAPSFAAEPAAPPVPSVPFEKYRLDNGLEVILAPDHRLPLVAVNLWYHVGAANEEPGRTGFAHLFEHMMFTGTKHIPRGLDDRLLEGAGVADSNATTSFDRTNYFDTLPANQLELGLWIHADRMGYLLDALDQKALSNQQDVVRNERRQTTENRPYGVVDEALFAALFPPGHPYRPAIIGSHADIQAANLADVRDFFKRFYRPNNASLVIAGDFDPANARRLVQRYFGPLARGPAVARPTFATPPIDGERRLTVTDQIELPRVDLAWLTPPAYAPDDAELRIAADILAGGKSSRLYKKLVYELQLAQGVSADQDAYAATSIFTIEALARPGHAPAELEAAIDAELAKLATEGPSQAEVDRARTGFEYHLFQGLEKLGGQSGRANRLNHYNQYTGDPGFLAKDLERFRRVTPADVRRVIAERLAKNARVVVFAERGEKKLAPDAPAAAPAAVARRVESVNRDEAWRRVPPKAGPAVVPNLPVADTFELANGLKVILLERPDPPVVSARLVVNAGLFANPPGAPGLADFSLSLFDEGTATRGSLQIADDFAQLGADYSSQTLRDASVLQVDVLASRFPAALAQFADVIRRPAFPPAEVERQRQSRLASIVTARDDPDSLADAAFRRALYGSAHPYGTTTLGTEASIKALSADRLRAFWQTWFVPGNAALVVVGAIDRATLEPLVKREFGDWTNAPPPPIDAGGALPPHATSARRIVVDKAGGQQTALRIGRVAARRSTPDFLALQLLNEAFGGGFTSRLMTDLRETKGYTYAIGSRFDYGRAPGPFVIGTSVRNDAVAPAVKDILADVTRMRTSPPRAGEFDKAKNSLLRSLPAGFETNAGIAGSLGNLFTYGLPRDYFSTLPARLGAIKAPALAAAARQYLITDSMVVIGVGDAGKLATGLDALRLGPAQSFRPDELF